MINYEERFGGDREWKGLTNALLPRNKREAAVARAVYLAGKLDAGNWERPDCDAVIAFPDDELPAST